MATSEATQKAVESVFSGRDIPDLPEAGGESVVEYDVGNLLVVDPRPVNEKVCGWLEPARACTDRFCMQYPGFQSPPW